jgi:protoporphyrin/coproporphyrin ferrochelatase
MQQRNRTGILLMNLGSPNSTTVPDVRRYLDEFLMDKRVIDYPAFFRNILVRGIIIPFRAPRSAAAYRTIWTPEGSPLIVLTKQLRDAVQAKTEMPVAIAMRYGLPTPKMGFDELLAQNPDLQEVIMVPLYPHYAMSSYETAVEHAMDTYRKGNYAFKVQIVPPFYSDSGYIQALVSSIRPYLNQPYDHILFSYHGIPERHVRKSDPSKTHCLNHYDCCSVNNPTVHAVCYTHQTRVTTMLTAAGLGLKPGTYSQSFQSRIGKKWLTPYTDMRLQELPKEGIKNLVILCPAFVSDCLETLEEIAEAGKETFLAAGGETFTLIPCLNTHALWVNALLKLVEANMTKTDSVTISPKQLIKK